jgi:hypothetical protein
MHHVVHVSSLKVTNTLLVPALLLLHLQYTRPWSVQECLCVVPCPPGIIVPFVWCTPTCASFPSLLFFDAAAACRSAVLFSFEYSRAFCLPARS